MSVLTDPIAGLVVRPLDCSLPEAVVYLVIGDSLVLADLSTPIADRLDTTR